MAFPPSPQLAELGLGQRWAGLSSPLSPVHFSERMEELKRLDMQLADLYQ